MFVYADCYDGEDLLVVRHHAALICHARAMFIPLPYLRGRGDASHHDVDATIATSMPTPDAYRYLHATFFRQHVDTIV